MNEYHKIQTVFKRDPETRHKTLLEWEYTWPEFEYLSAADWVFTEKVDGTNIRVMCSSYEEDGAKYGVVFGGKTDNAQLPSPLVSRLQERFHVIEQRRKLQEMFPDGACLYGEGYGAKIQKVGECYGPEQDFVLFDVKVGDLWLARDAVIDVGARLTLNVVPIIGAGTLHEMVEKVREGFRSQWGDFEAEGIVARPAVELQTRRGERIITKLKCRDFQEGKG